MLFQMCYGPEIKSIYEMIRKHPGCTVGELREWFQYQREGDIKSLIEGVVTFLTDLELVTSKEGGLWSDGREWDGLEVFLRLRQVARHTDESSLDHVFAMLHYELFVKPNRL